MYTMSLCDDNISYLPSFRTYIKNIFEEYSIPFELNCFTNLQDLDKHEKESPSDLLFLDILLLNENGMEYAKKLRKSGNDVSIIFITTSRDYAIDSFDVMPIYYLLKPINPDKLKTAVLRALSVKNVAITFDSSQSSVIVDADSLLYMEVFNHTIIIHKTDGTTHSIRGNLSAIEKTLPALFFLRIHRSYIVNLKHVNKLWRYYVELTDGTQLPVARNQFNNIRNRMFEKIHSKSPFL